MTSMKTLALAIVLTAACINIACAPKVIKNSSVLQKDKDTFLRLEYEFGMRSGATDDSDSNGAQIIYDIDTSDGRVFEKYTETNPIEYHIGTVSEKTYSVSIGSTDTLWYTPSNFVSNRSDSLYDIRGTQCSLITIKDTRNLKEQYVFIDLFEEDPHNVHFPLKYFSLNKSAEEDQKMPLFNPEIFNLGIPYLILTPMDDSGLTSILKDEIDSPFILDNSDISVKLQEEVYLTLELIDSEYRKDHMKLEMKGF